MKYLLMLAVLAGGYYQFFLTSLNEASVREFLAAGDRYVQTRDFDAMADQLMDPVMVTELDQSLQKISRKSVSRDKMVKVARQMMKPEHDMIEKSDIEKIEIVDDKAIVTSLDTMWITADGFRIKSVVRSVSEIVVDKGTLRYREVGSYNVDSDYWTAASE